MVWFYNPGISWASPVWGPTGAGGAVLSELEVLRVRRCSLKGRVIIFHINLQIPPSSNYRAWVMTILISYDKFTQYYRDLAEHSLLIVSSSCVTTLPWPHSELKKKKKINCQDNWKMKLCRKFWVVFLFQERIWPWVPTNWEIYFEDSDILTCFSWCPGVKRASM